MISVILGCGDVGQRIVRQLKEPRAEEVGDAEIIACTRSEQRKAEISQGQVQAHLLDLDQPQSYSLPEQIDHADVYYLIPPQKQGAMDQRSRSAIKMLGQQGLLPRRIVLISTTGVYGDCQGEWVTEQSCPNPQTERGQRRLDSERQWSAFCHQRDIEINILRVPGIYAWSRIPRQRLERRTPVVRADECGFTNRIHADDLARIAITAMSHKCHGEIFNATDGTPGKISEYLQAACEVMNLPPLPEISMQQAEKELSEGMLSYLRESRKISNRKMIETLEVTLTYPDFRIGLRH